MQFAVLCWYTICVRRGIAISVYFVVHNFVCTYFFFFIYLPNTSLVITYRQRATDFMTHNSWIFRCKTIFNFKLYLFSSSPSRSQLFEIGQPCPKSHLLYSLKFVSTCLIDTVQTICFSIIRNKLPAGFFSP